MVYDHPTIGAVPEAAYPRPILDLLAAAGSGTVVEHGDRRVSGNELLACVGRIAGGLRAAGVGPGHGVGALLGVTPEALAAVLASHLVGARVVGARPGLTPPQLRHVLGTDTTAILLDPATATAATRAVGGATGSGGARQGGAALLGVGPVPGLPDLVTCRDGGGELTPAGLPGDVARVVHTSGSTGLPKGCAQTYAALGAAWAPYPSRWPPPVSALAAGFERFLVFGTLASQVMLEYATLALAAGGTLVLADPAATPGPLPFLARAVAAHRATASVITVPRLYQLVACQRSDPLPLGGLRRLLVSGSPLPARRLTEAVAALGPVIFHGYGQTETGMIAMLTPDELAARPATAATVGRPPAAVQVEVRDPDGLPLPAGVDGEIVVRTPAQASGYWGDPAATAEVFAGGWVRTRDLGHLDADGYLHLTGRARDVVIVDATLIHIGPIELALAGDPAVAEAYVVSAPDERTGEAPHAFVVPAPGATPDPARLRALVAGACGDAAVPRSVTVIDAVPLAASGKPDKHRLRRAAPAGGPVAGIRP